MTRRNDAKRMHFIACYLSAPHLAMLLLIPLLPPRAVTLSLTALNATWRRCSCKYCTPLLTYQLLSCIDLTHFRYLAVKQFSSTAFQLCTRIGLNFYRLANECNGRIFMHFLSDAALVEVIHAACLCSGGDRARKAETFLYKFTLALLKFANRRGRLLSSTDNDSFFRNLQDYGRSLVRCSPPHTKQTAFP